MLACGFCFWTWRLTLASGVLCLLSEEYSSYVRGLPGNPCDLAVASSQHDTLFRSETLVLVMRHVSKLLVPGFGRPVLLWGARCLGPEGLQHTYEMVTEHFANPNFSVVVDKCWFLGFVV